MKTPFLPCLPLLLLPLLPAPCLAADPDPDLPQPFDPASVAPVVSSSPFTRMVNISDNLVLTGIAYIDGKPVATVFNKETKESHVVTQEPNFQGWTLNEVMPKPDVKLSQARITIGGETIHVRYGSLNANDMKADKKRPEGDRGGGPPPPPGGGSGYSRGSRGPSEEDRRRYEAMSDAAKEKVRNLFREKFSDEKFRNAPEEERRNIIRSAIEKIEKEDKGGGGGR